jgi:hypothetical protein
VQKAEVAAFEKPTFGAQIREPARFLAQGYWIVKLLNILSSMLLRLSLLLLW